VIKVENSVCRAWNTGFGAVLGPVLTLALPLKRRENGRLVRETYT